MKFFIKKASPSDASTFAQLTHHFWSSPLTEDLIRRYREHILSFQNGFALALIGDRVVGSAEGFPIREIQPISQLDQRRGPVALFDLNGKYYYIHIIQVLPEYQRQGIGDALFKNQLEVARIQKAEFVCGMAFSEKTGHWLNYGFQAWGKVESYQSYGLFQWIIMELDKEVQRNK